MLSEIFPIDSYMAWRVSMGLSPDQPEQVYGDDFDEPYGNVW